MCSTSTLFILLSDLFDTVSLDDCEDVFSFVEQRVSLWKMVSDMCSASCDEDDESERGVRELSPPPQCKQYISV